VFDLKLFYKVKYFETRNNSK